MHKGLSKEIKMEVVHYVYDSTAYAQGKSQNDFVSYINVEVNKKINGYAQIKYL